MKKIKSKSNVKLGVVPTHIQFIEGLVPDDEGKMPRNADGQMKVIASMADVQKLSNAQIDCVQISLFPGVQDSDLDEMVNGLKSLGMEVHFILMVGGAGNPLDPADESAVVDCIVPLMQAANQYGIKTVSSTSIEQWMQPNAVRLEGTEFEAAIDQNVKVHTRACEEAGVADMTIDSWHIEFLRNVEFATFTDLDRAWKFVKRANESMGSPFFKVLVDAAHCGDSGLSMDTNLALVEQIAAEDGLGIFHASAKTTRGCHSTGDGWIGAMMAACARTGKLEYVFSEMFHHQDVALEPLRAGVEGHGVDTTNGRTYDQMLAESLDGLAHRLNNFVNRGMVLPRS